MKFYRYASGFGWHAEWGRVAVNYFRTCPWCRLAYRRIGPFRCFTLGRFGISIG